jgi:2,3,4,5-tetrahydropyridine-2,6-dicarboxylate N-succinyltransferase
VTIREHIEQLFAADPATLDRGRALAVFGEFKRLLNEGAVRAAERNGNRWIVNHWVKQGILLGFRLGRIEDLSINERFRFFDKDTYPPKELQAGNGVRLVPGGSVIRDGAYVAPGVVCMPPMYINVGAYVDADTMVDSHALVGSCAQVGKRVHISAGAQIGGVLEPVGAMPVIIEDDVIVGGNCGIYEGAIIGQGAVLAAGVVLTGGTPVFDIVNRNIYRKEGMTPLYVPPYAVVVPGTRPVKNDWARGEGLSIAAPVIIKYRDEKTDGVTALEESLR